MVITIVSITARANYHPIERVIGEVGLTTFENRACKCGSFRTIMRRF